MTTVLAKQPFDSASSLPSSAEKDVGEVSEYQVDDNIPALGVPSDERVRGMNWRKTYDADYV